MFVLGNGESRTQINLDVLKTFGKVYGCNALYRDFTPDALIAVDGGMMHEISASGYANNNLCYFRSWSRLPEDAYAMLVNDNMFEGWHESLKTENEKQNKKEFVLNGTDPNQIMRLFHVIKKQYEERNEPFDSLDMRQRLGNHHQWVTWVDEKDEVKLIPYDYSGWSAGPIAVRMMLEDHNPSEIYMIGFDMNSIDGKVNNVYKGTSNYVPQDVSETPSVNWKNQHIQNFKTYPNVKFFHVSPEWIDIEEWKDFDNVDYLTFDDLQIILDKDFIL